MSGLEEGDNVGGDGMGASGGWRSASGAGGGHAAAVGIGGRRVPLGKAGRGATGRGSGGRVRVVILYILLLSNWAHLGLVWA